MTSLLNNTTGALVVSLIVSAVVTTGPTGRLKDAEHDEFSKPSNGTSSPGVRNVSLQQLARSAAAVLCNNNNGINCNRHSNLKRLHPEFHSSFSNADLHIGTRHPPHKPILLIVVVSVLAGAASTITIGGNLVVIAAILLDRKLRRITNYYVLSLAISDVWVGIGGIPLYTHYFLEGFWALGRLVCDAWLVCDWTICTASQYTVFLITLDRYLSVTVPITYRNKKTDNKVIVAIVIAWLLPCCLFTPLLLAYEPADYVRVDTQCDAAFLSDARVAAITAVLYYWVSAVLMCYFYWRIYALASAIRLKQAAANNMIGRELFTDVPDINVNNSLRCVRGGHWEWKCVQEKAVYERGGIVSETNKEAFSDCPRKGMSCRDLTQTTRMLYTKSSPGRGSGEGYCSGTELPANTVFRDEVMDPGATNVGTSATNNNSSSIINNNNGIQNNNSNNGTQNNSSNNSIQNNNSNNGTQNNSSNNSIQNNNSTNGIQNNNSTNGIQNNNSSNKGTQNNNSNNTKSNDMNNSSPYQYRAGIPIVASQVSMGRDVTVNSPQGLQQAVNQISTEEEGSPTDPPAAAGPNCSPLKLSYTALSCPMPAHRDIRIFNTISVVLGAYLFCWTPYHILIILPALCGYNCVNDHLYVISYGLCYLNSAVNPFLYAYASDKFKLTIIRVIKGRVSRTYR